MSAIAGGAPVCVAWQEKAGDMAAQDCAARAEKTAEGWRLSGEKDYAHGAARAQAFLVSARSSDGVGLFIVKADAAGLSRETRYFTDGTTCDRITLRDVVAEACVGAPGVGEAALDAALDETRIAVSAEMLGCARAAFDMTVEYLKTRKQFGKAIGSFQALQHRAVDLYVTQEIMRSAVDRAVRAFPEAQDARERALIASACKARCSDGALQIAKEAIQMHGAIGYTDEHDIGLFVRRALVRSAWLGNSAQHRKRYAALSPSLDLV
jgi:alkylation response protein AidB-like acyl-CoA dehydrogenase